MTKSAQKTVHGPRRFGADARSRRTAGQSLIVALVVVAFLTAVMGTVTLGLLTDSSISSNRQTEITAFYVARAGIEAGVNQLLAVPSPGYESLGDAWHSSENSELRETKIGLDKDNPIGVYKVIYLDPVTGQERIGIQDEESKLNVNKAEPAMLKRLDKSFTDAFVQEIVERRTKRPFISLSELGDLKDAPAGFMTISRESLLTVWGDGKVNVNTAPPVVLASLGMDEEHIAKVMEYRKGAGSPPVPGVFKTVGEAQASAGMDGQWLTTASPHFSITSQGYLGDNPTVTRKVREVVQRGPNGVQVLQFDLIP